MYYIQKSFILLSLWILMGCVPSSNMGSNQSHLQATTPYRTFHTSSYNFISPMLQNNSTQRDRNRYLKEFLSQSDVQCQHYLRRSSTVNQHSEAEQSLYMSIFDTVSMIFGISYITETAKQAINATTVKAEDNQVAYQNALTPEIFRGVEIGRIRYGKKMLSQTSRPLKEYSVADLQRDMLNYDKMCSREYGLIEINRALKEVQYQMMQPQDQKPKIDPVVIKKKVEAVTKEVKKKEKEREDNHTK